MNECVSHTSFAAQHGVAAVSLSSSNVACADDPGVGSMLTHFSIVFYFSLIVFMFVLSLVCVMFVGCYVTADLLQPVSD